MADDAATLEAAVDADLHQRGGVKSSSADETVSHGAAQVEGGGQLQEGLLLEEQWRLQKDDASPDAAPRSTPGREADPTRGESAHKGG